MSNCRYGQIYQIGQEISTIELNEEVSYSISYLEGLINSEIGSNRLINYTLNSLITQSNPLEKIALVPKNGFGHTGQNLYYNPSHWADFPKNNPDTPLGD